jgi:hypothetical protein
MATLTDKQIAEYFHRSYTAVDGLWFMKSEERHGFDEALAVDTAVWQVMPKIQARKMQTLLGKNSGLEALYDCFKTKLSIEGYTFAATGDPQSGAFEIAITNCPWLDLLHKSNRQHLAGAIGDRICTAEYGVWAKEFGEGIRFEFGDRLCNGCSLCMLRFRLTG